MTPKVVAWDSCELSVKDQSAGRAAELVRCCKVAALGTLHHGAPSVSMVPYAISEDPFAFIVLVSTLSAHTREMLADPNVALLIMEPETDTKQPHTLARVSMHGKAERIAQDAPRLAQHVRPTARDFRTWLGCSNSATSRYSRSPPLRCAL